MLYLRCRLIAFSVMACLACAVSALGQDPEQLTEEQMRDFLLTAKVVKFKQVEKGLTGIFRLTLSDGTITHDAAFQSVDEYKPRAEYNAGDIELNFKDSYKYNIAAYELAKLLGLRDMMPVTVERRWRGTTGSLSWWLPYKLDEEQRQKQNITAPDPAAWAKQMQKMNVFAALVYDTDRNRGNVLYSEDWHLWMIDFTRAFRVFPELQDPKVLITCDRQLWEKLRQWDLAAVKEKIRKWLNDSEIKALTTRRDKIVAVFEDLIAKKGEKAVIYN